MLLVQCSWLSNTHHLDLLSGYLQILVHRHLCYRERNELTRGSLPSGDSLVYSGVSIVKEAVHQPQSLEQLHFKFPFSLFAYQQQVLPIIPSPEKQNTVIFCQLALLFSNYIHFYLTSNYSKAALVILTLVINSVKLAPPSCCIYCSPVLHVLPLRPVPGQGGPLARLLFCL